jgi:tetratricopeptide (TPR) repeat protein
MRAGAGARSKSNHGSRGYRCRQAFFWPRRGNEAHVNEAFRLSPRDKSAYWWLTLASMAKFSMGKDEEAVAWLRRAIETNRNHPMTHFYLAAALAHLGRMNEAQAAGQAGLALNPSFTITRYRPGRPSDNPTYVSQRVIDGMRKAGVPEG